MTLVQTRQCLHLNIVKCKSLQFLPSSCPELCLSVQIVVFGGTETDMATAQTPSSSSSYRINLGAAAPAWETETMPYPRVMGDAVLLPDGTVFVANGSFARHQYVPTDLSASSAFLCLVGLEQCISRTFSRLV